MKTLLLCGALLVLTGPAGLITVDHHCRSYQTCVFYGALGCPLYLQLPDEDELQLKKIISETSADFIFHFKNQKIRINHSDPRWQFNTENKTLIITRAEKEDSGRYRLWTFNSTGKYTGVYYLQLIIEAVVSSVKVTDSCISIGKRKVHCSSDGDQIQFSWTLNGILHDQNVTDGNQTLLLDYTYTGSVTCNVKNHVSSGSDTVEIEHCPGLITVDHHCRSDQTCVIYGALGRPLYLQLPDEDELQLIKIISETSSDFIFIFKNQKIRKNPSDPRWQFNTENKTMIITRAEKEDSGRYTLWTFSSTGKDTGEYKLQLIIEAVVSSVEVTDSCISIGKRKVHCSSDGDQIQFSWTLNGIPHDQNLIDGNQTLLLDTNFTGSVSCRVKNHISSGFEMLELQHCPGIPVFVLVWVLEIIFLLALLAGFYMYGRIFRKQSIKRNRRSAESKSFEFPAD